MKCLIWNSVLSTQNDYQNGCCETLGSDSPATVASQSSGHRWTGECSHRLFRLSGSHHFRQEQNFLRDWEAEAEGYLQHRPHQDIQGRGTRLRLLLYLQSKGREKDVPLTEDRRQPHLWGQGFLLHSEKCPGGQVLQGHHHPSHRSLHCSAGCPLGRHWSSHRHQEAEARGAGPA